MAFACIFVPDFPAEALARVEPELREQAVAVVEGTPPLLRVTACNERARQAGVEPGMTQVQARGRLRELALRRRSSAQESAAHAALLDCACAFSPRVQADSGAPDTMVLDLAGLDRLFGPPARIARELARRAAEMGLEVNVAVAANAETANCAARGFAGITVIPSGQEAARLKMLPLDVLLACATANADVDRAAERDWEARLRDTLDRWGVRTFRGLAMLPETAVRERLGETGVWLQRLARGEGSRPMAPVEAPLHFEEVVELEHPVALLEPLAFLLNRMLEQLCARLAARALATQELRLRLALGRGEDSSEETISQKSAAGSASAADVPAEHALVLRMPVPMLDAKVFLKLLQLELRAKPPGAPVEKIFLEAEPVRPRFTQGGLFLPTAPEPERLEVTLARIKAVVGETQTSDASTPIRADQETKVARGDRVSSETAAAGNEEPGLRVGVAELLDTHRPDAFCMRPFAPEDTHRRGTEINTAREIPNLGTGNSKPATSALRRFRPPLAVRVEVREGRPVSVSERRSLVPHNTNYGSREPVIRRAFERLAVGADDAAGQERQPMRSGKSATGRVLWAAGPWRESGEWWTQEHWSREVWDVALQQDGVTAVYRLGRDLSRDEWFVEAMYD